MITKDCINCKVAVTITDRTSLLSMCSFASADPLRMHVFAVYSYNMKCYCGRVEREPCLATPGFDKIGCKQCGHSSVFCHMITQSAWFKRDQLLHKPVRNDQYRIDLSTGNFVKVQ